MIEIGLCTDDRYIMPAGVCITSIFESNKKFQIRIHLLTDGLSVENIQRLKKLEKDYGQTIEIHVIDSTLFDCFPTIGQYNKSIYYRYLLPMVLDSSINKVLYLDSDIIVVNEISVLWNIDLKDYFCGVIIDANNNDITIRNRLNIRKTHLSTEDEYFNSGVLLMNIDLWRANGLFNELVTFVSENKDICRFYPDQDALNCVFVKKILFLPIQYNLQEKFLYIKEHIYIDKVYWESIDYAIENPVIIHYSSVEKPWHKECTHPWKCIFDYYRERSRWSLYSDYFKSDKIHMVLNLLRKYMGISLVKHYYSRNCEKFLTRFFV